MKKYYVYAKFSDGTWAETSKGKEIEAQSEPEALNIFIDILLNNHPTFMKGNAYIVKTKVERKATQEEEINSRVKSLTQQVFELDNLTKSIRRNLKEELFWTRLTACIALTTAVATFIILLILGA